MKKIVLFIILTAFILCEALKNYHLTDIIYDESEIMLKDKKVKNLKASNALSTFCLWCYSY